MKLKRFLCLCLALCMVLSLSLPAFAVNGEETGSEPSETPVEVTEGEEVTEPSEEPTEPSETPVEDTEVETPTEPSETPTEPSVTPIAPSLDGATVNVSQESIAAIADAVTMASEPSYTYAYQYTVCFGEGLYVILDTNEPDLLTDHTVAVIQDSSGYKVIFDPGVVESRDESVGQANFYQYLYKYFSKNNTVISFESVPVITDWWGNYNYELDDSNASSGYRTILWSSKHIYDKNNKLVYESTYVPPVMYTISFVTGIEDFTIESVEVHAGDVYNLPEFSYAGYQYMGAFTDETYETAYVGGSEITGDLTLYLKFEPIVYDVGSTVTEISNRLEGLTYVVLAQSIITSVGVLALFFFRRDSMGV